MHANSAICPKCESIFDLYPGFHPALKSWFLGTRYKNLDAHISCAGRGRALQEAAYASNHSKARYGESAHNYNMAIDIFQLSCGMASFDTLWYRSLLFGEVPNEFLWYGAEGPYREYPHVEVRNWKEFTNFFPLVEP